MGIGAVKTQIVRGTSAEETESQLLQRTTLLVLLCSSAVAMEAQAKSGDKESTCQFDEIQLMK